MCRTHARQLVVIWGVLLSNLASAEEQPASSGLQPLPTLGRYVLKISDDVFKLQDAAKKNYARQLDDNLSNADAEWRDVLNRKLIERRDRFYRDRFSDRLLEANIRSSAVLLGGGAGFGIGGPAGATWGAEISDVGAKFVVEKAFGDQFRRTHQLFADSVETLIVDAVQAQGEAFINSLPLRATNEIDAEKAAEKFAAIANSVLEDEVLADLKPEERQTILAKVFDSKIKTRAHFDRRITSQELNKARTSIRAIKANVASMDARMANFEKFATESNDHIRALTASLNNQTAKTAEDVRFLMDASFGTWSLENQREALKRGIPSSWNDEERRTAEARIGRLLQLQQIGGYVGLASDLAQFGVKIADLTGADPNTRRSLEVFAQNLGTAEKIVGVFTAYFSGGWISAISQASGLLSGGQTPSVPPELIGRLNEIQASLNRIEGKVDKIIEMQQDTLSKLDSLSLQVASAERSIMIELQSILAETRGIRSQLNNPYYQALTNCKQSLTLPGTQDSRISHSNLTGLSTHFDNHRDDFTACFAFINKNTFQLLDASNQNFEHYHVQQIFQVLPQHEDHITRAVKLSTIDWTLAIRTSVGNSAILDECHQQIFALLSIAPRLLANIYQNLPYCGESSSALKWNPSTRISFDPLRALDAPIWLENITSLVELGIRTGDWRALVSSTTAVVSPGRIMTSEEAFGDGSTKKPDPSIWTKIHRPAAEALGDVVDVAIAQEVGFSGAYLARWIADRVFVEAQTSVAAGELIGDHLGQIGDEGQIKRAWAVLLRLQNDQQTLALLRGKKISPVDAVRAAFDDKFDDPRETSPLRDAALRNEIKAAVAKLTGIPSDPKASEVNFLHNIAWLLDFNRDDRDAPAADIACRSRMAESQLVGRPLRTSIEFRGLSKSARVKYLEALRTSLVNDPFAYHVAVCLMEWNPFLETNAIRYAVIRRLNELGPGSLAHYRRAVTSEDSFQLRTTLFPGWALRRTEKGLWGVLVRMADGRPKFIPFPSYDEVQSGRIAHSPALEILLSLRSKLAEHALLYDSDLSLPMPFIRQSGAQTIRGDELAKAFAYRLHDRALNYGARQ